MQPVDSTDDPDYGQLLGRNPPLSGVKDSLASGCDCNTSPLRIITDLVFFWNAAVATPLRSSAVDSLSLLDLRVCIESELLALIDPRLWGCLC